MRKTIFKSTVLIILLAILIIGVYMGLFRRGPSKEELIESLYKNEKLIEVSISAFQEGGDIPAKYTCVGEDINPEIVWSGLPENTASIMVIMYDPDAPVGYFIHWVIFNIPPTFTGIPEGESSREKRATLGVEARNDFGRIGYGGPCPPPGPKHRYYFLVLALDTQLDFKEGEDPVKVIQEASKHVIGYGVTYGRFGR